MNIGYLRLTNFRNHKNLKLDFKDDINLITGPNGAGKTNILEAIYILSCAKSPKARYDRDTIDHNSDFCTISGEVVSYEGDDQIDIQIIKSKGYSNSSSKKIKVNKVAKSQKALSSLFNAVLFSPEDIAVINGSPSERRKYMNMVLYQIDYDYKRKISEYTKAMRQRNKILEQIRDSGTGQSQLSFWTDKILVIGNNIIDKRKELMDYISEDLGKNGTMSKRKLEVKYKPSKISENRFQEYENAEIASKTTLIGPHRDDFEILYEGYNITEFGSRGQQRSAILALKLAEIEFIKSKAGERPVLLLDDIFSELDLPHRLEVLDLIEKQQTIITSAEDVDFAKNLNLIRLDQVFSNN